MTAERGVVECGECEGLRILRVVVEGNAVQRELGLEQARVLFGRLPGAWRARAVRARCARGARARSFRVWVASVESLRLLAMVMGGGGRERADGVERARVYLNSLRLPEGVSVCGPKQRVLSGQQLRLLAAWDALGVSFVEMARRLGFDDSRRRLVHYHLRPSAAMLAVMVDGALGAVVSPYSVDESVAEVRDGRCCDE